MANFRLVMKDGMIMVILSDGTEHAARLRWARPLTHPGVDLVILARKDKELASVHDLSELDEASRNIVNTELDDSYILPRINRVIKGEVHFGTRYLEVETDMGYRHFSLRNAQRNVQWTSDDRAVIRDTLGNRYVIESLKSLPLADQRLLMLYL